MNADWETRYRSMIPLTERAGSIALEFFDTKLQIELKPDESPVTLADRETEAFLRKSLEKAFPNDGFLGEEYGESVGTSGYRWIIDPIDGTRNFIRGIPIWATLVSLEYLGEPIAGVCSIPAWNMVYRALKGNGAYRDNRPIHVSLVDRVEKALLSYSSIRYFQKSGTESIFHELCLRSDRSRGFCDFYGFVLLAQGSVDVMIDHGVHIWDVAGLKVIIEEAGRKFSDWSGNNRVDREDVVATNGFIHEEVISIIQNERSKANLPK